MNLNKINNFVAEHPEDGSIKDITLCNNVTNKEFHLQPAECQPIVDNMAEAVKCVTVGNGTTTVTPDPGYNSMRSVVVCAKVPVENKSILLSNNNSNTCIKPSPGYTGLSGVNVCVAIPTSCPTCCYTKNGNYVISKGLIPLACANVCVDVPIQDPVAVCITKSGTCTIKPTTGNVGLSEVDITTDFNTIDEVNCNITSNGDYTIHTPAGYSAMGTANINVNVPAPTIHAQTCHVTLTQNDRYVEYTPEFGQDYFDKFIVCTNIPTCGVNCTITSNGKYAINSALLGGLINSVSLNVNVVDGGGSIVPVAPITKYHIYCSSYYDNTEDNSGKCGLIFTPWSLDEVSGMTPEERNDYMKGKEITAILYNYGGYACDIPVNKAAGCWDSNEGHALNCGCLFAYADYLCYEIGQCGPVFVFETRCTRDSVAPYTWSKFGGAGSGCIYKLSVYGCAGEWEQHDGGFNAPVDITCCITENGHYILHCDGDYINCATVTVDVPITIAGNVCASCACNEVGLTYAPAINTSGDCFGKMCGAYGTVFGKNCYQFYTPGDIANKNGRYKGTFICNGNCIAGPDTAWICLVHSDVYVFVEGCQTQWSWIRCSGYEFSLTF